MNAGLAVLCMFIALIIAGVRYYDMTTNYFAEEGETIRETALRYNREHWPSLVIGIAFIVFFFILLFT